MKSNRLLALLFVFVVLSIPSVVYAQAVTVSGKITDNSNGTPLEGATVKVKNSNTSTVSDADGNFSLTAPSPESIISITYVGFRVYEAKAGNGRLSVKMAVLNSDLNDVVVVGYGTQRKIHLTGAVETFDPKQIEDLPVGSLGTALQSRILGLGVSGGTTRPGSTPSLTIRNPVTLSKDGGNLEPLYVIDGIVQIGADGRNDNTYFNNLDASEVESISVLKDASAAVYGSRASNGVILVTTKRGKSGKPRISYSGAVAVNDEAYRSKMLSAYDYARYYNIMNGPNGANRPAGDNRYFFSDDELNHYKNIDFDRLDMAWKKATTNRHTLNVSGGTDRATYFAGASIYTQTGNLATLDYEKWTFRGGSDVRIANGFKVGMQVAGNYSNSSKTFNKIGGENDENDYRNLLLTPRMVPSYVNGFPVMLNGWRNNNLSGYHFDEIDKLANKTINKDRFFNINSYLEYEAPFVKGLKARFSYAKSFGFNSGSQNGSTYSLYKITGAGANGHIYDTGATVQTSPQRVKNGDRLYYSNSNSESTQMNFGLSYARSFGFHTVSALFSVEKAEAYSQQEDVWKESPSISTNGQFGSAFGAIDGRTSASESGALGYIGRLNYAYNDKYLAEFLFRTDASTKFAPENYWGNFYALSTGWVISKEKFFTPKWVDFLKIRYSIGVVGKDDVKPWLWRQRYTYQADKGAVFGGNSNVSTGMKMEASPNRDATWSNELKNNFGVDARFMKNKLAATVEVFYNHGTDILMERTAVVPITVGGSIASENWGIVDFYGYELGLGWNDRVGRDFTYGIDARFSWNDNKMLQGNFAATNSYYPWLAQEGQSTDNGKWGYDYLGMFQTTEEVNTYITKNGITSVFGTAASQLRPGMLYYRDVRGALKSDGTFAGPDGKIDENDQVLLARKASNHYGIGMTLKLGYKGFNLNAVIGGSFGGYSEIDGVSRKQMNGTIENNFQNVAAYWADIYDPVLNPAGKFPNPNWQDINLDPSSSFWEVSAFRMAMRNVNLSYSIPSSITERLKINNARLNFSILNPMYLYNPFSYKAPEGAYDTYPNLRTYSLGVNVSL